MNSDQFDDLTRTLASGTSRRQLLTMMGSGLVTLFVSMFARTESESVKPCPKSNRVRGTCDKLKKHIKEKGVQDEKRAFHPNKLGWTNSFVRYSKPRLELPLLQTVGDTICITVQNVRVQFYARSTSCQITWTPPKPLPRACQDAIRAWHRATELHEKQHKFDAIRVARRANANWNALKLSFTGCGSDQQAAETDLYTKVSTALDHQMDLIEQESEWISGKFHATPEGKDSATPCDCVLCNPTLPISACGEQCCGECEVCNDKDNTCVSKCRGECVQCKDGECVRTCTEEEYCCGKECINLNEKKCCINSEGSFSCPANWGCCTSGQCCQPNSECCPISLGSRERACVPYGNSNCGNCIRCGSGQECCIKANGVVAGCCGVGRCHPERGCT